MDDLIFKNYSLINEIKKEYEKIKKENEEFNKHPQFRTYRSK